MDQHKHDKEHRKPAPEDEKVETVSVPDAPVEPRRGNANDPDQSDESWRQAADSDKEPHLFGKSMVRQQQKGAKRKLFLSPQVHS